MALSRRFRKKHEHMSDLELTTFLNLLVVLISFLLVTAVFSRISIQELKLPTPAAGGAAVDKPLVTIEVIVRKNGLEVTNGKSVIAAFMKKEGAYDLDRLSNFLLNLKGQFPEKTDATMLVEQDIPYEDVIHVMDAVKMARAVPEGGIQMQKKELFPDVSIGDAP